MSDLVGNPEDRFFRVAAHTVLIFNDSKNDSLQLESCSKSNSKLIVQIACKNFSEDMKTQAV